MCGHNDLPFTGDPETRRETVLLALYLMHAFFLPGKSPMLLSNIAYSSAKEGDASL